MNKFSPVLFALAIAACGQSSEPDTVAKAGPPSSLDINSSKRQCATTASMSMLGSGVPEDAIEQVCDCSVDRMVENGAYTSAAQPDDAAQNEALNACVEELAEEMGDAE